MRREPNKQSVEELPLHEIDRSERIAHLTTLYVPPLAGALEEFQETIAHLRAPEGCPWDREQTHLTIRGNLLEEAYEVLEALDREDPRELAEELGDLLLQILLHAQIATEAGDFRMADVVAGIDEKIHRRHPHVFGKAKVDGVGQVLANWEQIKAEERNGKEKGGTGLFDGVPRGAAGPRAGRQLPEARGAGRVRLAGDRRGESQAGRGACRNWKPPRDEKEREHELGDVFFAVVNLARWLKVDPEVGAARIERPFPRAVRARGSGRGPARQGAQGYDARGVGRVVGRGEERRGKEVMG